MRNGGFRSTAGAGLERCEFVRIAAILRGSCVTGLCSRGRATSSGALRALPAPQRSLIGGARCRPFLKSAESRSLTGARIRYGMPTPRWAGDDAHDTALHHRQRRSRGGPRCRHARGPQSPPTSRPRRFPPSPCAGPAAAAWPPGLVHAGGRTPGRPHWGRQFRATRRWSPLGAAWRR